MPAAPAPDQDTDDISDSDDFEDIRIVLCPSSRACSGFCVGVPHCGVPVAYTALTGGAVQPTALGAR